eukprot:768012-Hanusia_phi.AAC.7
MGKLQLEKDEEQEEEKERDKDTRYAGGKRAGEDEALGRKGAKRKARSSSCELVPGGGEGIGGGGVLSSKVQQGDSSQKEQNYQRWYEGVK